MRWRPGAFAATTVIKGTRFGHKGIGHTRFWPLLVFLPVYIQHNQGPCHVQSYSRRDTSYVVTKLRRIQRYYVATYAVSTVGNAMNAMSSYWSGWRRKGTDWKGVATRARAKERADRAKEMRRP